MQEMASYYTIHIFHENNISQVMWDLHLKLHEHLITALKYELKINSTTLLLYLLCCLLFVTLLLQICCCLSTYSAYNN